ncbi:beta-glucosidase [Ranunculus cassubicifolius]
MAREFLFLLIITLLNISSVPAVIDKVQRSDFPCDFAFGVTTAAVEIEGATDVDGKGESIWDHFVQTSPVKFKNGSLAVACDSYRRYKEDISMLKYMGVTSYRLSIPWTRILPNGSLDGGVNKQGIDHYNDVFNELKLNGIVPYVTLLHFDLPQALQDKYDGLLGKKFVDDFKDYCDVCFKHFGDKVKNWITINEPTINAQFGYGDGLAPPMRCSPSKGCKEGDSGREPYIVVHHILLAHAAAARLYNEKYKPKQGGEIGISLLTNWYRPYSDSTKDLNAADRMREFNYGWLMEPLQYGCYPLSMRNLVGDRLPKFTDEEKDMVTGSLDFLAINYYTSTYAKGLPLEIKKPYSWDTDSCVNTSLENAEGKTVGPLQDLNTKIAVDPDGLRELLRYLTEKYDPPKIYITENGYGNSTENAAEFSSGKGNDHYRIKFIIDHLEAIKCARKEGANVMGYFAWSLMDNLELLKNLGTSLRFGLWYTDYDNDFKRIPKASAEWYRTFLSQSQATPQSQPSPLSQTSPKSKTSNKGSTIDAFSPYIFLSFVTFFLV